jgi:hypothetical protein
MFPGLIVFIVLIPMVFTMIVAYKCMTTLMQPHLVIPEEMLYLP